MKEKKPRARKLPPIPPTTWTRAGGEIGSKHINHFGLSGGKDSTRLAIWAVHESGYPRESLDFTFCDTGNESPITLKYIDYLEEALGIPITRVKPGLDFWELAKRKRRFPSAKARFCTYWLKIAPTLEYINATFRTGHTMTLHSGVRAAESASRAKLEERAYDEAFLCEVVRPLLRMDIAEVWEGHHRHGIKPNPLYAMGMARVGCFPCVMSRKGEIRQIAKLFPEAIDNIREKENESGRDANGNYSSFFAAKTCPPRFHSRTYTRGKDGAEYSVATIDDIVAWAQSGKGAKHDPRTQLALEMIGESLPGEDEGQACNSNSGLCE